MKQKKKLMKSDATEHTNDDDSIVVIPLDEIISSDEYNGFIDTVNVTFGNVGDEEVSVSDLPASDQTNETEK